MNPLDEKPQQGGVPVHRSSWPYLRTPARIFWLVMGPICVMQVFLLLTRTPTWIKISAACVLGLTIFGFMRGYVRRLRLTREAATLSSLFRKVCIPWSGVRRTGSYIPGGGLGATEYAYITTHDRVPDGKWEIDSETIQIQNQDGLLEAIEAYRRGMEQA